MGLYRDDAIVLRTYKLGEADRIVVLLTAGRGKVRAVAKGIRKTKSRLGGRLQPGANVSLLLYEGRGELDVVSQAETIDHHRAIHEDLGRLADAMALLEAVDQVATDHGGDPALYRMLRGALTTLDERRSPLLVAGFYWKLLALEGLSPVLDACVRCGRGAGASFVSPGVDGCGAQPHRQAQVVLVGMDVVEGGAVCRECRSAGRTVAVSEAALDLIRRILGGDLAGALAEPAGPATSQAAELATVTLEAHLERRLRSVRLLPH